MKEFLENIDVIDYFLFDKTKQTYYSLNEITKKEVDNLLLNSKQELIDLYTELYDNIQDKNLVVLQKTFDTRTLVLKQQINNVILQLNQIDGILKLIVDFIGINQELNLSLKELLGINVKNYNQSFFEHLHSISETCNQILEIIGNNSVLDTKHKITHFIETLIETINYNSVIESSGILQTNNINIALKQELLGLVDTDFENLFYKKIINNELLGIDFNKIKETKNHQIITEEKIQYQDIRKEKKGHFIIGLDISHSTNKPLNNSNIPILFFEIIMVLNIIKKMLKEKRNIIILPFNDNITDYIKIYDYQSAVVGFFKVLNLVSYGFTDVNLLLNALINEIDKNITLNNCDLLLMTDGEFVLDNEIKNHNHYMKMFLLLFGLDRSKINSNVFSFFDNIFEFIY